MSTPRLFKFRVWHPELNQYFYTSHPFWDGWGLQSQDKKTLMLLLQQKNEYVTPLTEQIISYSARLDLSVEQWTGLTDSVGKDIFEGDVVEWSHPMTDVGEVVYVKDTICSSDQCFFGVKTKRLGICHFQFDDTYLVVGNIHQTPSY